MLFACAGWAAAGAQPVDTAALNRTEPVRSAFQAFYNMDYAGALAQFERIDAANPDNPLASDYLLYVALFQELNRRDLLDTTFYANDGFLSGKHTVTEDPAVHAQLHALADKAESQADALLARNPKDVDALFARGWARSLNATYQAMVERSFVSALKLALQAKNDEQQVLQLDPRYVDANLVTGVYEYVVGALPFTFRMVVGIAGISGSKQKGMAMLQIAAAQGVLSSVEARTCMMLFLRREGKYSQAQSLAASLTTEYPRDYLFELELANLEKDGGEAEQAIAQYHRLLGEAQQPGYFHNAHLELAYFGLGDTLRGQKNYVQAAQAYAGAAAMPTTSPELKQRCLVAAGKTYDLMNQRARAVQYYQEALAGGSDTVQGDDAKKFIRKPYVGS